MRIIKRRQKLTLERERYVSGVTSGNIVEKEFSEAVCVEDNLFNIY